MRIFELSHIGEFHVNHNEDFLLVTETGSMKKLIAVMDGCSSGTDSHFASTLIGKLLRKLAKQEAFREFAEKESFDIQLLIESICLRLFEELRDLNSRLDLKSDEILSTLILGIIDEETNTAEIIIIGDGVVHVNGETTEFENDNKPDYIGYHLSMDKDIWLQTRVERMHVNNIKDLTISTDGIHTFKNFDGKSYESIEQEEIIKEFFESRNDLGNQNKLKKSLLKIKKENGLLPSDDLTMIRVIND